MHELAGKLRGGSCSCAHQSVLTSPERMKKRVRSLFAAILILVCGGFLRVEGFNCTDLLTGCKCKGHGVDIDISKAFDYP